MFAGVAGSLWLPIILLLIAVAAILNFNRLWHGGIGKKIPPGTMGLPVIGETLDFLRNINSFLQKKRSKYGSVFKSHIFGSPTIICSNPEITRFALHNAEEFVADYPETLTQIIGKWNIMSVREHKHHKKMRGFLNTLIGPRTLKSHLFSRIDDFTSMSLQNLGGTIINLQHKTRDMAFYYLIGKVVGFSAGAEIESLKTDYFELADGLFCVPVNLPGTAYRRGLKARERILSKLKSFLIRKRRSLTEEKHQEYQEEEQDLMTQILTDETQEDTKLNDEQILDFLVGIIFAGHENTANTMMMAIKFLHDCPAALEHLRTEHMEILKKKQPRQSLTWEDYRAMAFTHKVILETIRAGNVVPGIMRRTTSDIEIAGYKIPKGWKMVACFTDDLSDFDPCRRANDEMNSYMPFGGGMRMCPGKDLAMVEMCLFLHYFALRYGWKQVQGDEIIEVFPRIHAAQGLCMKLEDYGYQQNKEQ